MDGDGGGNRFLTSSTTISCSSSCGLGSFSTLCRRRRGSAGGGGGGGGGGAAGTIGNFCSGTMSTATELHLLLLDGATGASCSGITSTEFHLMILAGATAACRSVITSTASEVHLLLLAGATRASCSNTISNDSEFHLLSLAGASASPRGGLSSSTSSSLSTLLLRLRGSRGCEARPRSTKVSTGMVLTSVVGVLP